MKAATIRSLAKLAFYGLLVTVLYLTVKPNPAIQEVGWMPAESAEFFDLHDGWKNVVGYGALGLAGFLGWPDGFLTGWAHGEKASARLVQAASYCGIVVFMELLQLFIPTRHCDIKDMAAGSVGVLLAWMLGGFVERLLRRVMRLREGAAPK